LFVLAVGAHGKPDAIPSGEKENCQDAPGIGGLSLILIRAEEANV
jgi:hypothetical protein